eukprot:SAG31_NODE_260_length_18915_cov_3.432823_6_plen_959_part_00
MMADRPSTHAGREPLTEGPQAESVADDGAGRQRSLLGAAAAPIFDGRFAAKFVTPHAAANVERFESLDYHSGSLGTSKLALQRRQLESHQQRLCGANADTAGRWAVAVAIGIVTGTTALVLGRAIELLLDFKIERLERQIEYDEVRMEGSEAGDEAVMTAEIVSTAADADLPFTSPLLDFIQINLMLAAFAALPVILWVPEAAGSGIPEVVGYLNGVHIPRILRAETFAAKVWGTVLIVASGIAVGPEGPLVHAGAIIGSGLTRRGRWRKNLNSSEATPTDRAVTGNGRRCWWWIRKWQGMFHNDLDRRDFISMGAAAGFAAAFGAPIGGVLFALEEATSFWSETLMWRALLCTSVGCFTLSILKAMTTGHPDKLPGGANYRFEPGMLTLNTKETLSFSSEWELMLCAVEGILGGVLGALFVKLHTAIAAKRPKPEPPQKERYGKTLGNMRQRVLRFFEVVLLSVVTSLVMYGLPYIGSDRMLGWACQSDDSRREEELQGEVQYKYKTIQFYCNQDSGPSYNDVATIFLTSRENAILQLIEHPHNFSYFSLLSMTISFFVLMLLSFGAPFPAGIFMPTIAIGTTGGAMFGRLVKDTACILSFSTCKLQPGPEEDSPIERAGPYALMGAVALLGGIQRSSLSLVVIIVEGTGKVDYLLPIILTTICAKWAGDQLNHGIYHTVLAMKQIPFLESPPPPSNTAGPMATLTARDLLAGGPVDTLPVHARVQLVIDRLQATPARNGFPVVEERLVPGGRHGAGPYLQSFQGFVLRSELLTTLKRKRFYTRRLNDHVRGAVVQLFSGGLEEEVIMERVSSPDEDETVAGSVNPGIELELRESAGARFYEADEDSAAATPLTPQTRQDAIATGDYQARSDDERTLAETIAQLTAQERELFLDVGESMNPAPYSVHTNTPAECIHRLFRVVGLRHLVVLDDFGQVAGVVTRQDILKAIERGREHHT